MAGWMAWKVERAGTPFVQAFQDPLVVGEARRRVSLLTREHRPQVATAGQHQMVIGVRRLLGCQPLQKLDRPINLPLPFPEVPRLHQQVGEQMPRLRQSEPQPPVVRCLP